MKLIPFRNLSITRGSLDISDIGHFIGAFKNSLENLELKSFDFKNDEDCINLLRILKQLKSLKLNDCRIDALSSRILYPIETLEIISFEKCDKNIYQIFRNQKAFTKISSRNDEWTWKGFPHAVFNELCRNSSNLDHISDSGRI